MSWLALQSQTCKLHIFIIFLSHTWSLQLPSGICQHSLAVLVWFFYLDSWCPFGCNGWLSSILLPLQGHKSTGISSWALEVTSIISSSGPIGAILKWLLFWSGNITKTKNMSSALGHITDMIEMRRLVSFRGKFQINIWLMIFWNITTISYNKCLFL